jgi:hypothetical protein
MIAIPAPVDVAAVLKTRAIFSGEASSGWNSRPPSEASPLVTVTKPISLSYTPARGIASFR